MFSCCRANSTKSVKSTKKDKNKKGEESTENAASDNNKKLIIPTITIENGKTNDNTNDNNDNSAEHKNATTDADTTTDITAERNLAASTEAIVEENLLEQNDEYSKKSLSSPTSLTDDNSFSTALNQTNTQHTSNSPTITATTTTTTTQHQQDTHREQQPPDDDDDDDDSNTSGGDNIVLPTKSCLSRHNSTHHSIKKKVNISAHTEIIEPDPLPPPPYDHASLGDDDDVFSDSLPPQKRESMCAPYIERDDDEIPETVAFTHGLPEWFNDERINDIGCIEPPVTPVGRDELELKRQRLYNDLLRAAQAAVEHSVRFTPFTIETTLTPLQQFDARGAAGGGNVAVEAFAGDCDPDLKPSVAENLEHLVNRLERLVERLERSISARELEIANRTFDSVLEKKRESFDLETTELPPLPATEASSPSPPPPAQQLTEQADQLNQRIERIESSLNRINDRHSSSLSASISQNSQQKELTATNGSLENIPTVVDDYQSQNEEEEEDEPLLLPPPPSMSVLGYQDIVSGPLSQFLALSAKIGGDVGKQAQLVKSAFDAQLQYVTLATQCAQPSQDKQMNLLQPTSMQISAIQDFREKNRASPFFNHLSAISESIPALGWVCVSPTPGPHVKEMNDAGQFYTNRVLKEWKEKDATHVEWARAWVQTLTELQAYIKQFHTTGLVWSGKGGAPAGSAAPPPPPIGACPPPPPPPAFDLAAMSLDGGAGDERSALFAEINQGEGITRNLKKVTDDMQTHKNATLRTGPAPFKTPAHLGSHPIVPAKPIIKDPVFTRDGKKWIIEHQRNNPTLLVENAEMNNVVYVFKCEGSTLTVKGKVNNIVMDSCKKCSLLFDSVVASIEFVNCQSVQMQTLGFVPTVSIDKTDGCQMYLSKESLGVEIVSSKSSEMNVMLPGTNGDYTELALPEQFKTTIAGKTLKTVCVDSLG